MPEPAPDYRSFAAQTRHYFARPHEGMPESAVAGESVWRGIELRNQPSRWLVALSSRELADLEAAISGVRKAGLGLEAVTRENFQLPVLGPSIARWRQQIEEGLGFVVVRGLPVERWSPADTALAFWGIGHHLGLPGAQNPAEELLGEVRDYDEEGSNPHVRRYRTAGNIDFHCDAADVVGLLCVRPARSGGQSRIVSTGLLFNEARQRCPEAVARLFEPFKLDGRGEQRPGKPPYSEVAPCCYTEGALSTFYHSEYFRSVERLPGATLSPAERLLLDTYDTVAAHHENHLDMWLQAGDMQFLSNHTIAHARTAYEDDPDPLQRRLLLRLWLSFT